MSDNKEEFDEGELEESEEEGSILEGNEEDGIGEEEIEAELPLEDEKEKEESENSEELNQVKADELGVEGETISGDTESIKVEEEEIKGELTEEQIHYFHRNLVEGALYVSGKPLSIEEISTKLEIGKKKVEDLLSELALEYLDRPTAIVINQVGETFQMALKTEYVEKVSKFAKGGAIAEKYLRTLTIIALKQPILKSMVIKLRGTGAYEHVKYLVENGLVEAVKKGRSQELTTTDMYAEMFGLPKNREEMKRMMMAQLGINEGDTSD